MNIQDVIIIIRTIAETSGYEKPLSLAQLNSYLSQANLELYESIYGFLKEKTKWEQNQATSDSLFSFKETTTLSVDASGQVSYPSDYYHWSSAVKVSGSNYYEVDLVTDTEVWDRLRDSVKPPAATYPVACLYDTYIQFYPVNIGNITFNYLRYPVTPVYNVSVASDGVVSYSSTGSVQLEWPQRHYKDIIRLILSYIGVSVSNKDLTAYMDVKTQQQT